MSKLTSFLTSVVDVGRKVGQWTSDFNQEVQKYKEEYQNKSDDFLRERMKDDFFSAKKSAAMSIFNGRVKEFREQYDYASNEILLRLAREEFSAKQVAAKKILNERRRAEQEANES